MKHRSYRGRVSYLTDGVGEMGREMFHVTIQPDGTRTMRATCELDDDRLLRDVVTTVDKQWRPLDAFVRLTINEQLAGTSWFRFTTRIAECESFTAKEGRVHQIFDIEERVAELGTHPVHADAWGLAQVDRKNASAQAPSLRFSTSTQPCGGLSTNANPRARHPTRSSQGSILRNYPAPSGTSTYSSAHSRMNRTRTGRMR